MTATVTLETLPDLLKDDDRVQVASASSLTRLPSTPSRFDR